MNRPNPGFDPDVYKNAKSTRPAWANALIIALVLFVVGVVLTVTSGIGTGAWVFLGTLISLVVAGILALSRTGKPRS